MVGDQPAWCNPRGLHQLHDAVGVEGEVRVSAWARRAPPSTGATEAWRDESLPSTSEKAATMSSVELIAGKAKL